MIESTVARIVDNSLRHDDGFAVEARSPLVRSVYKLARRADQDTKAHQRLKETAVEFLKAGACALGIGGSLVDPKAIAERDFAKITELAKQYVAIVKDFRAEK